MKATLLLLGILFSFQSVFAEQQPHVRIATSADSYPYNYGTADGCADPRGVCGFEIDLFDAICRSMSITCDWVVVPWVNDPNKTPLNPADNILIFDVLTKSYFKNPALSPQVKRDINQEYGDIDMVVASADASPERRKSMLFTAKYYGAKHLFVAPQGSAIKLSQGGQVQKYFPENNQRLRIGTWTGFLSEELERAYGKNLGSIELIKIENLVDANGKNYNDPMKALVDGRIDAAFVYTGIETRYVNSGLYKVVENQLIGFIKEDPFAGVAAATNISARGRAIEQIFSNGLVKVRKAGIYQDISRKWLGYDIWDCELSPQIQDPACRN